MNPMVAMWLVLRVLRWVLWLGLLFACWYVSTYRASILTSFGQLPHTYEALLFGLGIAPVFVGFLELMVREKAGIPRPEIGRSWSGAG